MNFWQGYAWLSFVVVAVIVFAYVFYPKSYYHQVEKDEVGRGLMIVAGLLQMLFYAHYLGIVG